MRRSDLLYVVGMTTTTFNALAARGLLPFTPKRVDRAWATFEVEAALRLALFMDLAATGMPQTRASLLVRDHFDDLLDFVNIEPKPAKAALLFGCMTLASISLEVSCPVDPKVVALCAVEGGIDEAVEHLNASCKGQCSVRSICVINASDSMARILTGLRSLQLQDGEVMRWADFMRARR